MRETSFAVGGYVVHRNRVLLLWHSDLGRWVPAGGRIQVGRGEYPHEALVRELREECGIDVELNRSSHIKFDDERVRLLPTPIAVQEITLDTGATYLDMVYFGRMVSDAVSLNYQEARAYHWFTYESLDSFPLMPHVRAYARAALEDV